MDDSTGRFNDWLAVANTGGFHPRRGGILSPAREIPSHDGHPSQFIKNELRKLASFWKRPQSAWRSESKIIFPKSFSPPYS
jgi:hypothetical protein